MADYKSRHSGEEVDDAVDRISGIDEETLNVLKNQQDLINIVKEAQRDIKENAALVEDAIKRASEPLQSEVTARTQADEALSSRIDGMQSSVSAEATARERQDNLLRESVTSLRNEGTASVQELRDGIATERGRIDNLDKRVTEEIDSLKEYADKAGKVKVIKRNGIIQSVSEAGEVDIQVPDSIDENAVSAIVDRKVAALGEPTFNADTEEVEGGTQVTLSTESGHEVTSFTVKGGGGGGDTATAKIVLPLTASKRICQKGERVVVKYSYNHLNQDLSETGTAAQVTVTIQQGVKAPVTSTRLLQPSAKTYEIDLSDYTKEVGGITVRISAVADDGLRKNAAVTIDVRELSLRLQSTDFITQAAQGGHKGSIIVPYYISGAGTKDITLRVNGKDDIKDTVSSGGTTIRQFTIPTTLLTEGRNTVQMLAEADGLQSECLYFDLLYNPSGTVRSFVGLFIPDTKGTLLADMHLSPTVRTVQYEYATVHFVSFGEREVRLLPEGVLFSAGQTLQTYTKRYKSDGVRQVTLQGENSSVSYSVSVQPSSVSLGGSDVGVVLDLDADGRSNDESNPAAWVSGDVTTDFNGVDFISSGWEEGALVLRNTASAVVGYKPFAKDPVEKGWTMEVELKTDTVLDDEKPVYHCMDKGMGFAIYPSKAVLFTGKQTKIDTEAGRITVNQGIEMPLSTAEFCRIAFVIHTKDDYRLMELYADGVRINASIYDTDGTMAQASPQPITISSSDANVSVRGIKVTERALTDDELLNGYIVSRTSETEMTAISARNDVLNAQGKYEAPRTRKRGRLFIKRKGGLAEVFQSINKKQDFLCDEVRWESPFGKEYDFVAYNVYIRIQGTSSTKYPWKNIRIYLNKGENPQLWVNGVLVTGTSGDAKADAKKNKYAMSPTAKAVSVFTCKCDYSDSSMTHNTGFARLYHTLCAKMGLLTPPQEKDPNVRASIEGYPCDIYNQDEDGTVEFYGQYNFNNDKSKSDEVYGMKDINTEAGACSLEFLNNMHLLGLFKTKDNTEESFADFDSALEFNIPEDTTWATATDGQRTAIKRLWGFIGYSARSCGANFDDPEQAYNDVSKFYSEHFREYAKDHFDVDRMLMWFLFTDYLSLVDQRVKNMILRTWDGLKWYFTYYDGDTALGERNDSFLAYLYNVERNTYDLGVNKYAFEGHSSWLWCLVLGSFGAELRAMAERLRKEMTNEAVFNVLDNEQMGAWSERAYNKSGELKYIVPATKGTMFNDASGQAQRVFSNYIYALQGNRKAHRSHFIRKRFAFLDARYMTDDWRKDYIDLYAARESEQAPSVVSVLANEEYRFGYGTINGNPSIGDTREAKKGQTAEIAIKGKFSINDPVRIYGASAIRKLDLTRINSAGDKNFPMQNTIKLSKCTALREIDAGQATSANASSFVMWLKGVTTLEKLSVRNINGMSVGSSRAFDLTEQRRLKYLDARGTGATSVSLAEGCIISEAYLPETLTRLTLRSLPNLTQEGLHFEGWGNVTALNFSNCPQLDWKVLLSKCTNVKYVRIEGVALTGDGTDLDAWKSLGGLSANGSIVTGARFVGTYQLTRWREDIEDLRKLFPELTISQPEYTALEFDETADLPANLTNLDNDTGYRFSKKYAMSGHVKEIAGKRHRVLCKYDKQEKVMLYTRLHDEDGTRYADGEPAMLDGTHGDVFVYEPGYWYKGVNDQLGFKKYAVYAAEKPATPARARLLRESDMTVLRSVKLTTTADFASAKVNDENYTSYIAEIGNAKYVRAQVAPGSDSSTYFLTADDKLVEKVVNPINSVGFMHGMYVLFKVPERVAKIAVTFRPKESKSSREEELHFDGIYLVDSDNYLDAEPDWVMHKECLIGATIASYSERGTVQTAQSVSKISTSFGLIDSLIAGMDVEGISIINYEQWKDAINLMMAMSGSRTLQTHRETGNVGDSLTEPMYRQYCTKQGLTYYEAGGIDVRSSLPHAFGYDLWQGNDYELLGGIVRNYGYNMNETTLFSFGDRKLSYLRYTRYYDKNIGSLYAYSKYVGFARFMDVIDTWGGASQTSFRYASEQHIDPNGTKSSHFVANRLSNLIGFTYTNRDGTHAIRLQYTGRMKEISNDEYRQLWK